MALKLSKDEGHENNERWLLTYSDLITLLMIFFIVMYAMSNVDQAKYHKLATSLNSALAGEQQKVDTGKQGSPEEELQNTPSKSLATTLPDPNMAKAAETVKKLMEEKGLSTEVSVTTSERGVVISLKDSVLFESASAEIRPENIGSLIEIGQAVKAVGNYVRIEGYTDNVPINNAVFANNWDLSVMRASKVLDLIVKRSGFPPDKICAIGYGEYSPMATNTTVEGRSKNRKVDIVILSPDNTKGQ
ncbi:MAG: flagellar motor protein MotB [Eubacteriales bacterium]